jgi:hypothetical protein
MDIFLKKLKCCLKDNYFLPSGTTFIEILLRWNHIYVFTCTIHKCLYFIGIKILLIRLLPDWDLSLVILVFVFYLSKN